MTLYLITSVVFAVVVKEISAEVLQNNLLVNETDFDNEPTIGMQIEEHSEETKLNDIETTQNITSQDRISYHIKRGASYPPRFPHHHHPHHHPHHHHHHHPHSHHHRKPHHSKPRKKHRRGRKKPIPFSMPKPSYPKMSYKRPNKPIFLSEMLRSGGHIPYSKLKPGGFPIPEYIEEDDLQTNPFSTVHTDDTFPGTFNKFSRPSSSIEISDEVHDGLSPLAPIEEEIFFPGATNMKPFTIMKRPSQVSPVIWSPTKPPDIYMDEDLQENIRSVRLAKPQNSYIDKDIINLLTKIKQEGLNLDSKPTPTEQINSYSKDNVTEMNAAISKLLLPFLSESAVKQIQSYFTRLPSDKQHTEDKNVTKVVYIIENQPKEAHRNSSNERPYRTYSVTEPLHENITNNTTYFIMVKSPENKTVNTTSSSQRNHLNEQQKKPLEHTTRQPELKTATPPSIESLALQNYIMSLAGVNQPQINYLPRFNSYQKQYWNG